MFSLTLVRHTLTDEFSIGSLYLNGGFYSYTLEDADRIGLGFAKIPGKSAIPTGIYRLGINHSTRFKRDMPILKGVPGFTGIRIHPGNRDEDTSGCILVGNVLTTNSIHGSTETYNQLFAKMKEEFDKDPSKMFLYVERIALTKMQEDVLREAWRKDTKGSTA